MKSSLRSALQSLLPRSVYRSLLMPYHAGWAFFSAVRYGFPASKLVVVGVTGTKGKSSVSEMIATVLEEAGHTVAVSSTIHFKIGKEIERRNIYKMTLPGRGFIQKFLREAVDAGATHSVIELTSEAAVQYRHLFLSLNVLVFTNLEKEHLESHGGMENYFQAKFKLGRSLARSLKRPRAIVANIENEYGKRFLKLSVEEKFPFTLHDAQDISLSQNTCTFIYKSTPFEIPQPGNFSVRNALAAIKVGEFLGISPRTSADALKKLSRIAGRAERIELGDASAQDFTVIVDYAHTPDSLKALYEAYESQRKICVLGNTGGGRDTWKRPEMGRIADEACAEVILTNEDPYDENPESIVNEMAAGMTRTPHIIMDRREAIAKALKLARTGDAVLITGKGTDPFIMLEKGKKLPWSDAQVAREELEKILS
jgi:UDP-N-acetylmuramoyl-L-alanyl-D-glutamate--2,6-diaminopimelate ligase